MFVVIHKDGNGAPVFAYQGWSKVKADEHKATLIASGVAAIVEEVPHPDDKARAAREAERAEARAKAVDEAASLA